MTQPLYSEPHAPAGVDSAPAAPAETALVGLIRGQFAEQLQL